MTTASALGYKNFGYEVSNPLGGIVAGVSDVAKFLREKFVDISAENLFTVTGSKKASLSSQAFEGLLDLVEEGESIPFDTFLESITFLRSLPDNFAVPDINTEPSGALTFEWYKGPYKVFVISINGTNTLEFATLSGKGNELRGKFNYSDELPKQLKYTLEMFLDN